MTANEFKRRRKKLWSSIYTAAADLGVTPGCVSHWECGRRPVPETVVKLLECIEAAGKKTE